MCCLGRWCGGGGSGLLQSPVMATGKIIEISGPILFFITAAGTRYLVLFLAPCEIGSTRTSF